MNADQIREAIRSSPFQPFRLCLSAGRQLDVEHPEFVGLVGNRAVFYSEPGGSYKIIDLRAVASIDFGGNSADQSRSGAG